MKIAFLILFLYLSFLQVGDADTGHSSLIVNYPAPSGSYNFVALQNLQETPGSLCACNSGVCPNAGLLFMYTNASANNAQTLELCTNDGTAIPVPYPETCFNRFWATTGSAGAVLPNGCPTINGITYTQVTTLSSGSITPIDSFAAYTDVNSITHYVNSTVCCSGTNGGNPVHP